MIDGQRNNLSVDLIEALRCHKSFFKIQSKTF